MDNGMDPPGVLKGVNLRQNEFIRISLNKNTQEDPVMNISILAIDLAKDVFQLHGNNEAGKCILRKKLRRSELLPFIANLPKCKIVMEACSGAHHWSREFIKLGHVALMISPQFVKPFVKTNKNDSADAEAIAEAAMRPNMRFVPLKEIWQQELQALHRARSLMIAQRVAFTNALRGFLREQGYVCRSGDKPLRKLVTELFAEESKFSGHFRDLIIRMLANIEAIQLEINHLEAQIKDFAKYDERCKRIQEINGVGPLTASAIVASMGDPRNFKNGRHFSAWLGLVPKQNSSGGKDQLLGISKRGDTYLRSLLIHGARAVIQFAHQRDDYRSQWALKKVETRGMNKATVALANRNARVIWAMLAKNEVYKPIAA